MADREMASNGNGNHLNIDTKIQPSSQSFGKIIDALRKLTYNNIKLEADFFKEVHQLEARYAKLSEPLREKRAKIISGDYIPTDDECDFPNDGVYMFDNFDFHSEKLSNYIGIPKFWFTALMNAEIFEDMIEEHDEPALENLCDVALKISESEPMGFTLEFHFSPNEFFTNTVLTKEYEMKNVVSENDPFQFRGPEIVKSKGCDIDWKPGKNLTVKTIQCTQKLRSGAIGTFSKTVNNDSFFNFFQPLVLSLDDSKDSINKLFVSSDFEIGYFLRDRFVSRAVLFFTGEEFNDEANESEEMTLDGEDEEEMDEEQRGEEKQ